MVQDNHHAHIGDGIPIVASINHCRLKLVGLHVGLAVQLAHLCAWGQDVVKLLRVNVLSQTGFWRGHCPVFLGDVEIHTAANAVIPAFV